LASYSTWRIAQLARSTTFSTSPPGKLNCVTWFESAPVTNPFPFGCIASVLTTVSFGCSTVFGSLLFTPPAATSKTLTSASAPAVSRCAPSDVYRRWPTPSECTHLSVTDIGEELDRSDFCGSAGAK